MKFAFAGAVAAFAVAMAGSAGATVVTSFTPGAASPSAHYWVADNFNSALGLNTPTGAGYLLTTNHDSQGAPPANSIPYDTQYLSVLGNGGVSIDFGALTSGPIHAFEFDWGSIDSFNTLVIHGSGGDVTVVPGSSSFPNDANGNQILPGTNGLFMVSGNAGETFTGLTLTSNQNSFEVDNLAVAAVPEPATWAMMILGLGAMGMALRSRRKGASALA